MSENSSDKNKSEEKVTDKALSRSICASVTCTIACLVCLLGLSWAWFTASESTGANTISAATFGFDITVKESGESPVSANTNGYYILDPAKTYKAVLKRHGSASNGFCIIEAASSEASGNTVYYTQNISTDSDDYTLNIKGVARLKLTAMWGMHTGTSNIVDNGGSIAFSLPDDLAKTANPASAVAPSEEPVEKTTEAATEATTETNIE